MKEARTSASPDSPHDAPKNPVAVSTAKKPTPRIAIVDDNPINAKILAKLVYKHLGYTVSSADMFENGLELLHALSTSLFDLILLDIVMPVLDGCTTCLFIRGRSPMHSIPDFIVGEHRSYSLPIVPTITSSPQSDMESPLSAPPPYRPRALSSPTLTIPIETPPTILEFNSSVPIVAITSNARPHEVALYLSLGMNDVVEKPVRCGEKFAGIIRSLLANRLGSVDTVT